MPTNLTAPRPTPYIYIPTYLWIYPLHYHKQLPWGHPYNRCRKTCSLWNFFSKILFGISFQNYHVPCCDNRGDGDVWSQARGFILSFRTRYYPIFLPTLAHRCIGYRNSTWHIMPTSARLMYLSVHDSRDPSTPSTKRSLGLAYNK